MPVPRSLVATHLMLALSALWGVMFVSFPSTGLMFLVLLTTGLALVLRAWVAVQEPVLRGPDLLGPLLAFVLLVVPTLLMLIGSPLSVRGPEGAGPLWGGAPSVAMFETVAMALALLVLPACGVRAVWSVQDRARRIVYVVALSMWCVGFLLAPTILFGAVDPDAVRVRVAGVLARLALLALGAGFVYSLKAKPDLRDADVAPVVART